MRNLAAKVPEDRWPEFKACAIAACQAPSRAIACDLAGLVKDHEGRAAERGRLLHGRLRSGNRASENADHSPPRHQDSCSAP
jgi:hypothetical protein